MTDPQETSEDIAVTAHSDAEPDERVARPLDEQATPSTGGPASTAQSGVERSLTEQTSPGEEGRPDSQSRNPL